MTIPNRISIGLVGAFLLAAVFAPLGWSELASHIGAGVLMLVVGIVMFSLGWLGGGDAKLMAAAALWFGFEGLIQYLLMVSICGGALVLVLLSFRNVTLPMWACREAWVLRLHKKAGGVPYGIALAAGGLWLYPSTPWFASLAV